MIAKAPITTGRWRLSSSGRLPGSSSTIGEEDRWRTEDGVGGDCGRWNVNSAIAAHTILRSPAVLLADGAAASRQPPRRTQAPSAGGDRGLGNHTRANLQSSRAAGAADA